MNHDQHVTSVSIWLAVAAIAVLSLSGCATRPSAKLRASEPIVYSAPEQGLPALARVVVDEQPVAYRGFTFTVAEKEEFDRRRRDQVNAEASSRGSDAPRAAGEVVGRAIAQPWILPVLVVALPIALVASSIVDYNSASRRVPERISEKKGAHLAESVAERAHSTLVGTRASMLVEAAGLRDGNAEYPYLDVQMKSATLEHYSSEDRITLVAVAQAHLGPGVQWEPTTHEHVFTVGKDKLERRTMDRAVEELATSIVVTYLPEHPVSVRRRAERAAWELARHSRDVPEVRSFVEQYPGGRFDEPARLRLARMERAAKWKALGQKLFWDPKIPAPDHPMQ
jgi:hypothetical protein